MARSKNATPPQWLHRRNSGVLLHVSSLPGPYGIGDFGPASFAWIDALSNARQSWWQILPLSPPDAGDSPYQCFSSLAGNPNFISPDLLVESGLLRRGDVSPPSFPVDRVDFPRVNSFKSNLLRRAFARFSAGAGSRDLNLRYEKFTRKNVAWLEDYVRFMALRAASKNADWTRWPAGVAQRKPAAMDEAVRSLQDEVDYHRFVQFLFSDQLADLRAYAKQKGISLVGDMPMFVSGNSADVWANPSLFELERSGRPKAVAGVPPDYFSATGQRWGNPIFNWAAMAADKFAWWVQRLRGALEQVDLLRIDHFRGFAGYWRIPARLPTAVGGRWVLVPGRELFNVLRAKLKTLPFLAEDLGVITPDVESLRDDFGLPGMRVLQFGIGQNLEPHNPFLPHNYVRNCVVYTGTHDNDTTAGWLSSLGKKERANLAEYLPEAKGKDHAAAAWGLMRLAWGSIANHAVAPLQDILGLGSAARMNVPGKPRGNWGWRFSESALRRDHLDRLAEMTLAFGRSPS